MQATSDTEEPCLRRRWRRPSPRICAAIVPTSSAIPWVVNTGGTFLFFSASRAVCCKMSAMYNSRDTTKHKITKVLFTMLLSRGALLQTILKNTSIKQLRRDNRTPRMCKRWQPYMLNTRSHRASQRLTRARRPCTTRGTQRNTKEQKCFYDAPLSRGLAPDHSEKHLDQTTTEGQQNPTSV